MSCLRRILGVSRRDKLRNTSITKTTKCHISIVNKIKAKELPYFVHTIRMPNYRYPKITLEGRIPGQRLRGTPPKRWLDNIKSSCQEIGIASVCETILIDDRGCGFHWWKCCYLQGFSQNPREDSINGSQLAKWKSRFLTCPYHDIFTMNKVK